MTDRLITTIDDHGEDESIAYSITTTGFGSSPSNVVVKAYDVTGGTRTDVTDTVLSGSASVAGDVITLPYFQSATAGHTYVVDIKFDSGGNTHEPYIVIIVRH